MCTVTTTTFYALNGLVVIGPSKAISARAVKESRGALRAINAGIDVEFTSCLLADKAGAPALCPFGIPYVPAATILPSPYYLLHFLFLCGFQRGPFVVRFLFRVVSEKRFQLEAVMP